MHMSFLQLLHRNLLPWGNRNLIISKHALIPEDCARVECTAHAIVGWHGGEYLCTVHLLSSQFAPGVEMLGNENEEGYLRIM